MSCHHTRHQCKFSYTFLYRLEMAPIIYPNRFRAKPRIRLILVLATPEILQSPWIRAQWPTEPITFELCLNWRSGRVPWAVNDLRSHVATGHAAALVCSPWERCITCPRCLLLHNAVTWLIATGALFTKSCTLITSADSKAQSLK